MSKKVKNIENENIEDDTTNLVDSFEKEISNIPEKAVVIIVLLVSSGFVKEDTEKEVSGNIANNLINKGFAKLK